MIRQIHTSFYSMLLMVMTVCACARDNAPEAPKSSDSGNNGSISVSDGSVQNGDVQKEGTQNALSDPSSPRCTLTPSQPSVIPNAPLQLKLQTSVTSIKAIFMSDGSTMNPDTLTEDVDTSTEGVYKIEATVAGPTGNIACSTTYTVSPTLSCTVAASAATIAPPTTSSLTITPSKAISGLTIDGVAADKNTLVVPVAPTATHEYTIGVTSADGQSASCKTTVTVVARWSR